MTSGLNKEKMAAILKITEGFNHINVFFSTNDVIRAIKDKYGDS